VRSLGQSGAPIENQAPRDLAGRVTRGWLRECEVDVEGDPRLDRTWMPETEWASGSDLRDKAGAREPSGYGPSMRFELRRMLAFIALVGLLFAAIRSFLAADFIGLLAWPAMLGFGIDRLCGGHGTWGGTVAGGLGLAALATAVGGARGFAGVASEPAAFLLFAGMGAIWGFYLSIWFYIVVETLNYYFY
jgi:hypothetical protein